MRKLAFLAAASLAGVVHGAVFVNNYSDDVQLNGSPYAGEDAFDGDLITVNVDGSVTTFSSAELMPRSVFNDDGERVMMKFTATGSADSYELPDNDQGDTVSVSSGALVVYGTWNPTVYPNSHVFNTSVASTLDPGAVEIEVKDAPAPVASRLSGSFVIPTIDNDGVYDQDPTVGSIVYDRTQTPLLNFSLSLPDYRFTRNMVAWSDFSATPSTNIDEVFSGAWVVFEDGTPANDPIFSADGSDVERFEVGDLTPFYDVTGETLNVAIDLNTVLNGDYAMKLWAIPWHTAGYGSELGFGTGGFVEEEFLFQVTVVPEPAAVALLALPAMAALRRRRRA